MESLCSPGRLVMARGQTYIKVEADGRISTVPSMGIDSRSTFYLRGSRHCPRPNDSSPEPLNSWYPEKITLAAIPHSRCCRGTQEGRDAASAQTKVGRAKYLNNLVEQESPESEAARYPMLGSRASGLRQ